ncbi:MAG: hypothetical protein RXP91_02470 [Nitrososphaeria archaeon]
MEERVRRALAERGTGDGSAVLVGCAAEEPPEEWCPVDVVVFPGEGGQEVIRSRGLTMRVMRMRAPPREELPYMVILEDPRMEAAALRAGWAPRRGEVLRIIARRGLLRAAEGTARALGAASPREAWYWAMKSYALLVASKVAAAGAAPRPAHAVRRARSLGVLGPGPPGELSHVRRTVESVWRILRGEVDEEVEAYVFRRKAEALLRSGLLLDAMVLAFLEVSRAVGDDLAMSHLGAGAGWDPREAEPFLRGMAAEESALWRAIGGPSVDQQAQLGRRRRYGGGAARREPADGPRGVEGGAVDAHERGAEPEPPGRLRHHQVLRRVAHVYGGAGSERGGCQEEGGRVRLRVPGLARVHHAAPRDRAQELPQGAADGGPWAAGDDRDRAPRAGRERPQVSRTHDQRFVLHQPAIQRHRGISGVDLAVEGRPVVDGVEHRGDPAAGRGAGAPPEV